MPASNEEVISRIEAASSSYSSTFDKGHLALPPAKKYLVLTCMDARIDPARAFGIELGDAHVIRNAGASARDALRSIIISQQLLATEAIVIVKHTGCGMLTFKNEDAYNVVETNLGVEAKKELEERKLDFLPFPELKQAIQEDVEFLRGTKLVKDEVPIRGWVYEVETGKTVRVV
ncbi:carbonic anhydrase [Sordaria brevicollis]|uniref:Carbonic anhydrase n=1 Tax=Sordaria brevicollis TaxID=83679 RepID=A0AAE0PNZ7_SORBR|nr:carbonic anhydrase [Sordaria brevicollis]